ncbi:AMP-binding protein [Candidatus Woesearchaeota archaeon]|nr:AMP-binding protein [Candidatus Woesearchaeota archaeon]
METMNSIDDVLQKGNRPPNVVDYILLEKIGLDSLPVDTKDYIALLTQRREDILNALDDLSEDPQKILEVENTLIPGNLKYAVQTSPFFEELYREVDLDLITTREDLQKLPVMTNDHLRDPNNFPEGALGIWTDNNPWMVKMSGGSTGDPAYIGFSEIDSEVTHLVFGHALRKATGAKPGDKMLLFVPGESHPFGTACEEAARRIGVVPIYRHFVKGRSTDGLLGQIKEVKPDIIAAAPIGPKGAAGTLTKLYENDLINGTNIFRDYLNEKTIITGGAPIPKNLVNQLYDKGVGQIINAYGSVQTWGGFGAEPLPKEPREDNVEFYSDVSMPPGYWIVNSIEPSDAPSDWEDITFTVLGRSCQPIIRYAPGDYAKVTKNGGIIFDICRSEFFKPQTDGTYEVKISDDCNTCISDV